ncbi:NAD-glutamate dehydrogenase domain-containing protein [Pseudofrankia inefficax]|uniref:NAD-glutamate dehydrogenase n=1 Tax=Pseudofrankia inefficax (strain DSM 45817 / CECT 9037 / DDB 130130 / EuI1c) TaxID=298654 RepID=E3IY35_PSEI1|nr:NAD-glutamate dehydrogenase domain-containing protein [Pseudofrankia inefficax]ADP82633.1 NAD-glutamate dehydrogenase [Pseudofrankia inefficax]
MGGSVATEAVTKADTGVLAGTVGSGGAGAAPLVRFVDDDTAAAGTTRCVLTWPPDSGRPPLAAVVDVFGRLGVEVLDHGRPAVSGLGGPAQERDEYLLRLPDVAGADPDRPARRTLDAFGQLFVAVWAGQAELDGFTRLALTAGLPWREVAVIRAAWRFLHQTGVTLSHGYAERTVLAHPAFAQALLEYFRARFDPDRDPAGREPAAQQASATLDDLLGNIASLDEDRILRGLRDVLAAVVRTSFYQRDENGAPRRALALKIASSRLALLAPPRPWVEVFVTSPEVEGVHLRGGRVARGGLRFSDRPEDYRTEVHGLFRAQVTKNVVIVPDGAKGAFVLHSQALPGQATGSGRPDPARVRAAYRTFVSALLDVTDNLVAGKPVGPARTVVYDEPDPYLVVAADKGTASFSDLANEIAAEHGYWLGDAFASGGSVGYDHKAMGITARGAWESARQHLRELGVDAESDPFTVVGVGDMSGDVFGNGMLRSRSMRLVGAFDHRHVFVDPDPDPAASFAERQRLYDQPGSSWADYDPKVLSAGGGVFRRDARRVELSARAREVLGLPAATAGDDGGISPVELIRALLRAPVDLLYNGGIGTYVKASTESQDDAADHANDPVRVDAAELRAKVVVEGGNLGVTQAGRVEAAHHGVRINTDFLDNSAGVDTSDHEVNLKILLAGAVDDGELTRTDRDELLRSLTADVAAAVLDDSAQQAVAVSLSSTYASFYLDRHRRLLRNLEARSGLVRSLEHLPSEARLEELRAAGAGLTRPELAVLQAKAKTLVRQELLDSTLPDEPALDVVAQRYFPPAVRSRFARRISTHPLVREIIATHLANELVNRLGPGFVFRLEEQVGVATADAVRACAAAVVLFGLDELWSDLDRRGRALPAAEELAARRAARDFHELATEWLLRHARGREGTATATRRLRASAADLAASFGVSAGEDLIARIVGLGQLGTALDLLVTTPTPAPGPIEDAAGVHAALGERLGLAGLYDRLDDVAGDPHWNLGAKAALRAQLTELWAILDWQVIATTRADAVTGVDPSDPPTEDAADWLAEGPRAITARWLDARRAAVGPLRAVLAELAGAPPSGEPRRRLTRAAEATQPQVGTGPIDIAAATVALHELRVLVERAQFDPAGVGPRLRDR